MPQVSEWKPANSEEEQAKIEREKKFRARQLPMYDDGHELAARMATYVALQRGAEKPLTQAGCAIACNTTRMTIFNYGSGDYDKYCQEIEDEYRSELTEEAKPIYDYLIGGPHEGAKRIYLSDVVSQYNELAAMEREQRLYEKGRVADIFAMKAVDGWQDETRTAGTVNNTLVISGDSAEKALELLGYTKALPGK